MPNPETKKKYKFRHSPETIERIRRHNSSAEHIEKLRRVHTGNKYTLGREHTAEEKRKIGLGVHLTYLKKKKKTSN